jgi:hypothetical protein
VTSPGALRHTDTGVRRLATHGVAWAIQLAIFGSRILQFGMAKTVVDGF